MNEPRSILVTGGSGFLGGALARRLAEHGHKVRVLDNGFRSSGLKALKGIELMTGDVRDPEVVGAAAAGINVICHLAAINGTRFFYEMPDLVLEVGVQGTLNVIAAARAAGVRDLFVASSSEVYHDVDGAADESVRLVIPDPLNPRFSYAGSKILAELATIHIGGRHLERAIVIRPHNVYGPAMGWEHVIPDLVGRVLRARDDTGRVRLPIQGDGEETRSFAYIDDVVEGILLLIQRAEGVGIYNVGNDVVTSIATLAKEIGRCLDVDVEIVPGEAVPGSPRHRRPDLTKLRALGYAPRISLQQGLAPTVRWYAEHDAERPASAAS